MQIKYLKNSMVKVHVFVWLGLLLILTVQLYTKIQNKTEKV